MSDKKKISIAALGVIVAYHAVLCKKKKRSKRMKNVIAKRKVVGHTSLIKELSDEPSDFKNSLRMSESDFYQLLGLLRPNLTKQDTVTRQSIPAEKRLLSTLRFLATGRSYEELKVTTGIPAQTLEQIIPETCRIIFDVLRNDYMKVPQTKEEWKVIAQGFKDRWNVINCGGCIDGKHIRIIPPPVSGTEYYNYKNFHSVALITIVNSNYEFIYVDVGKPGGAADGGVFVETAFFEKLLDDDLNFPKHGENDEDLNFVFIGDEVFIPDDHILKPYPQRELNYERRVYNCRIRHPRSVVENTFGLIASVFGILRTGINAAHPDNINNIVLAICTLHNFLRRNSSSYVNSSSFDVEDSDTHEVELGSWRKEIADNDNIFAPLEVTKRKNDSPAIKKNREKYLLYFNGKGKIPWQDDMIKKGKA